MHQLSTPSRRELRQLQTGIESSADSLISGVGGFLSDPVGGVQGTVSGVNKLFGRANASLQGEEGQDDLLGYDKAKRAVATRFGVDVYSSNPLLQAELDRLAQARGTGSLALTGAMAPVGGAAGIALGATSATVKLNEMMRDHSVADLKKINAERLAAMGVGQDVIDLFLDSPELSPRHQTAIVKALERMDGAEGRALVVKQAVLTSSEDVALFRVRQLAMYLVHSERTARVERFVPAEKYVVAALDANGDLITAMPVDHLAWTRDVAAIAKASRSDLDVQARSRQLVLTGTISPLARSSMEAIGWTVAEQFDLGGL